MLKVMLYTKTGVFSVIGLSCSLKVVGSSTLGESKATVIGSS